MNKDLTELADLTEEELLSIAPKRIKELEKLKVKVSRNKEINRISFVYYQDETLGNSREEAEVYNLSLGGMTQPAIVIQEDSKLLLGADFMILGEKTVHLANFARNLESKFKGIGAEFLKELMKLSYDRGREFLTLMPRDRRARMRSYRALNKYYERLGFMKILDLSEKDYQQVLKDNINATGDERGGAFSFQRYRGLVKDLRQR